MCTVQIFEKGKFDYHDPFRSVLTEIEYLSQAMSSIAS